MHGENFAGKAVSLPDAFHGKPGVLVIGFTQASRDAVTQWGTWLANDPAGRAALNYYELPVLASVPKLLRGFVTGKVKAAVADTEKPHFLPLLDHEAEWRAIAHYANADDAYVLLIDGHGFVRWQTHGPPTGQTRAALNQELALVNGK